MGAGEDYMMIFSFWSAKAGMNETQWIEYFRKFPPPPLWLTWMIACIWDSEDENLGAEASLDPFEYDYRVYFRRTAALGFGTESDCKRAWKEGIEEFDNDEEEKGPEQEEKHKKGEEGEEGTAGAEGAEVRTG